MTISRVNSDRFYEDIAKYGSVYTFLDHGQHIFAKINGVDVLPFWSSISRMELIKGRTEKYSSFDIAEMKLGVFLKEMLPRLEKDGISVGVNWSGKRLVGYDIQAKEVRENIFARLRERSKMFPNSTDINLVNLDNYLE